MCRDDGGALLLTVGKSQIDALFGRQSNSRTMLDDSEFVPLAETILGRFEAAGLDAAGVEQLWDHAYSAYDLACRDAESTSSFEENKQLMPGYLVGPRRPALRKKKRRR